MEVVVVVPPWPHLGEPGAILAHIFGLLAQCLLDGWMDEDARHLWVGRRTANELHMLNCEDRRIDREGILEHRHGRHVLALVIREGAVRHGR